VDTAAGASRVVVVTGASDGVGAAAARALAARGDRVIVTGRSPGKVRAVADEAGAEAHVADFARLGQVRELAAELRARYQRIDVLLNNAGLIAGSRRTVTADGHELTFQVNHLAPYLLTRLLEDRLAAARGRVVSTSSQAGAARGARIDLDDLDLERGYRAMRAYQASKLANVLFFRELHRRASAAGSPLVSVGAHPGVSATGLVADPDGMGANRLIRPVARVLMPLLFQPAARGAAPSLYAATLAEPGSYTGPQRFGETRGPIGPAARAPLARDGALARQLWHVSEALTGFHYAWTGAPLK